jgi:hypothetical protein
MSTKRISGNRKRKTTGKQLITCFRLTLEAPGNPESDTDAHLDKSTIIFTSEKLQTCKPKQDSDTTKGKRPTHKGRDQRGDGQGRQHHGRPQQTSMQTTEDGTGTHEEQNQTDHHCIPHHNNRHVNYTQHRKQEHNRTQTRNRNTTTWTVRTETGQQGRKRSMGNKRYTTGRTPQTSINNQHKQSKARHELDRTINRYKELNKHTDSRPKQHKHYIKGKLMTTIAIVIMIIATASAAANYIGTQHTRHTTRNSNSARRTRSTGSNRQQQTNHKTRHKRRTKHTQNEDKDEET